jgi:hypothetical protein
MEVIFQGNHSSEEATESLYSVIRLFKERYHISHFRELHLTVTLVDENGDDVELVDSETLEAYRRFEVCREGPVCTRRSGLHGLRLVVDNTR